MDYISDTNEEDPKSISCSGIEGLISMGAEEKFGHGTAQFLRDAFTKQDYLMTEIPRRYGSGS